ncbi:hypothetical protein CTM97_21340 [Photobacterium phosphoreum]|uniref:Uncharacterized protein n=1 Tax=Photobacterium phosphoreum TaxID=659 RepID=A0A2T3JAG8_PHOPO|nr:hypothetical protein [Photobacterium phosphoreum]PSU18414.1 hypothetical protein CTM96_21565 [Photobacterium phosphoreum]PSU36726.1 hypothetical protein CTM97_21340 [Photobacterium phosphoreum]PSU45817.1 hypothetical protein C9J18_21475 [Photobacterium phosphoreum]
MNMPNHLKNDVEDTLSYIEDYLRIDRINYKLNLCCEIIKYQDELINELTSVNVTDKNNILFLSSLLQKLKHLKKLNHS